ncbi:MAG: Holliday junction helicase RuvA [Chitinophagaceae bacterium]|jgi:Holliday junction DNA helicase RuvA|nr:Holliday junction helicase RuvA [Chitinophagaceae bacterium]
MISFVRGDFAFKTPAQVIVDVNGVGYDLHISLNTYGAISNKEKGQLFTYLHITENAHVLYGFAEPRERELFLMLISVSGVGAATARMMLSGMKPEEITRAILQGNAKQLESIKGIGRKTAERLILELRDKVGKQAEDLINLTAGHNTNETDAVNALISLGIARNTAEQAIKKVNASTAESLHVEELIKQALKNI